MRISSHIARLMLGAVSAALVLGLCLASVPDRARNLIDRVFGTAPAFAFDGTTTPSTAALSPADGLRGSAHPPESAPGTTNALTALQYAAEQGQPVALAYRAMTCARSAISARSPTAIQTKHRARRRPASSPTPSSRSGIII